MREKVFKDNEEWLKNHLPIAHGGLGLILCITMYLLAAAESYMVGIAKTGSEEPLVNAIEFLCVCFSFIAPAVVFFSTLAKTNDSWIARYVRGNIFGHKVLLLCKHNKSIRANSSEGIYHLRNAEPNPVEDPNETFATREERENRVLGVHLRLGGWFNSYRTRFGDSSTELCYKSIVLGRSFWGNFFIEYTLSDRVRFPHLFNALDFVFLNPDVRPTEKVNNLTRELELVKQRVDTMFEEYQKLNQMKNELEDETFNLLRTLRVLITDNVGEVLTARARITEHASGQELIRGIIARIHICIVDQCKDREPTSLQSAIMDACRNASKLLDDIPVRHPAKEPPT